jgi:hypothetical protein
MVMTEHENPLDRLSGIQQSAIEDLEVGVSDLSSLADWEKRWLGAAGAITLVLRGMGSLPA